ncbi:MAG: DUF5916 domain-containing protein [Candidatus Neomarinimicrobiota bacterium]
MGIVLAGKTSTPGLGPAVFQCVVGLLFLTAGLIRAQSVDAVVLSRLPGPIQFDGLSDEAAWEAIEPLPLTMQQPVFGGLLTERSDIRIGYDDEYLYAAGQFYDTDPAGIRGNVLVRDGLARNSSDDQFALILDTFNDNENALVFLTNPSGSRSDAVVVNDAEGFHRGGPWNSSWNSFWDVAVLQNEEGWFVEMRIPFSSLRFQDQQGRVVMGLITWRKIGRKNEFQSFPAIPPKWDRGRLKPSIAQDVVFEGIFSRKPLYITPYVLGGGSRSFALNSAQTAYEPVGDDPVRNLGLDIKYGLTSNLTLDFTVNTDFAQVEADDERVNLTRFSLFFPEKRLFFQERASLFDFSTGRQSRLFYSRCIGLCDYGTMPIIGGTRLVGRSGEWDLGLLDLQTARSELYDENDSTVIIPSENFGILRLRRRVLNPFSYIGGILTSRVGRNGSYNYAYGLDGILRISGDDYFTYTWAQTFDDTLAQMTGGRPTIASGRLRTAWERRTNRGLGYDLDLIYSGADYEPGIGFLQRSDVTRLGAQATYGWYPGQDSRIYNHLPGLDLGVYWRNADRSVETVEISPEWRISTKKGAFAFLRIGWTFESIQETFYLSEDSSTYVPPGDYRYAELNAFLATPQSSLFHVRLDADLGTYYDGERLSLGIDPAWVVSRFLELSGEYQINRVAFPDRQQKFDARIARLRVMTTINTRLSASAFVQYSSEVNVVGINLRLRYNPREGTDLYLVYDEDLNTDRQREVPALPTSSNRTFLLKYSITFLPRLAWSAR